MFYPFNCYRVSECTCFCFFGMIFQARKYISSLPVMPKKNLAESDIMENKNPLGKAGQSLTKFPV